MGAYDEPTQECPYCGNEMTCDWVDVGVGSVQCGPYHCYNCGASEIGPEFWDWVETEMTYCDLLQKESLSYVTKNNKPVLKAGHPFTDEEVKHRYYKGKISPYANTVKGVLVDHKTAKAAYNSGNLDEKNVPR